jgi:hypothetical protein
VSTRSQRRHFFALALPLSDLQRIFICDAPLQCSLEHHVAVPVKSLACRLGGHFLCAEVNSPGVTSFQARAATGMNVVELSLCFLPFLGLVAGAVLGNAIGGAVGFVTGWLLMVSVAGKFTNDIDQERNE